MRIGSLLSMRMDALLSMRIDSFAFDTHRFVAFHAHRIRRRLHMLRRIPDVEQRPGPVLECDLPPLAGHHYSVTAITRSAAQRRR
jgi:hypothetical protein